MGVPIETVTDITIADPKKDGDDGCNLGDHD